MSKLPRRVLVADSDHAFAQTLRAELEARGYVVEVVSDGLSAINMVKTRSFSGAVVDTDLIAVDGLHVVGLVKDIKRGLPVVVTGKPNRSDLQRRSRDAGAEAFVAKPCAPAKVADALQASVTGSGACAPRKRPSLTLARLEAGQVLLIECPGGQVERRLSSRLLAKHPASLVVAAPRRGDEPMSLPFGVPLTVGFPMPDGWYYFDTYVLGAVSQGGEPAILLAQPKLVSHIQRRRFARTWGAFGVELGTEPSLIAARGQNAGEGGMLVLTDNALPVGSRLPCRIESGAEKLIMPGIVVWTRELRDNGHRYRTGIEFAAASGGQRKRLLAWVQSLQPGPTDPPNQEYAVNGFGTPAS